MIGSCHPKKYCDHECACINECSIGGIQCSGCGRYFCSCEIIDDCGDHYCAECHEDRREDTDEEEDGE